MSEDPVEPAGLVALVVPEDPVEPAGLVALVVSENPVGPAGLVARVVPEDPVEPVVQESPVVRGDPAEPVEQESPVVPEQELVQVEAALVRGHPRDQLAVVALRIKSVTAAHRHDLVPLLAAAEDLAVAVAETTREPAAAEAAIAWEVADTVAVAEVVVVVAAAAAVVAAVEAVAAAADAGDKRTIDEEKQMKTKLNIMTSSKFFLIASAILIASRSFWPRKRRRSQNRCRCGPSQSTTKAVRYTETGGRQPSSGGGEFRCRCPKEILGPDSEDIISSEDPVHGQKPRDRVRSQGKGKELD